MMSRTSRPTTAWGSWPQDGSPEAKAQTLPWLQWRASAGDARQVACGLSLLPPQARVLCQLQGSLCGQVGGGFPYHLPQPGTHFLT